MPRTKKKFESKKIQKLTIGNETEELLGVTITFPHLDQPWVSDKFKGKAEPKYMVTALLHKEDDAEIIETIQAHIESLVIDTWGDDALNRINNGSRNEIYSPLKDGSDMIDERGEDVPDYMDDYMALTLKSKNPVAVAISQDGSFIKSDSKGFDWDDIYAGCACILSFGLYTWDAGGDMVCTGLRAVIKVADGEPLMGEGKSSIENSFDSDLLSQLGYGSTSVEEEEPEDEEELDTVEEIEEDDLEEDEASDELLDELDDDEDEPEEEEEEEPKKQRRRAATKKTPAKKTTAKKPASKPRSTARKRTPARTRTRAAAK